MMDSKKIKSGIRFLIFFYCFILFQNILMRSKFRLSPLLEAVVLGTLIYLIVGFVRRTIASRWLAIAFHSVFQVAETVTLFAIFHSGLPPQLASEMPPALPVSVPLVTAVAFSIVTAINVGAVAYLVREKEYFLRVR